MHVVLVRPEIAPNTGNVIRLCANVGAVLHLVEPLGFELDDRLLRRAGLDYHELTSVHVHADLASARAATPARWFGFSSRATRRFDEVEYGDGDTFVFGAERAGLAETEIEAIGADRLLRIPMRPENRSLNLANAVSIVVYEAWRQLDFIGAGPVGSGTSETPGSLPFDE